VNPASDSGANVFAAAVGWVEGTLLGTVATAVAVIAVASVGFLLLSGRIDLRRGAQVIFGCFILFGASSIAGGIMRIAHDSGTPADILPPPPPVDPYNGAAKPMTKPVPYDPYAGAALPTRH
jgi:type IV secretory pathway VirB2 component (pilin)